MADADSPKVCLDFVGYLGKAWKDSMLCSWLLSSMSGVRYWPQNVCQKLSSCCQILWTQYSRGILKGNNSWQNIGLVTIVRIEPEAAANLPRQDASHLVRLKSEYTHHMGKDHCTADVQFDLIAFDQKRKYLVICLN